MERVQRRLEQESLNNFVRFHKLIFEIVRQLRKLVQY